MYQRQDQLRLSVELHVNSDLQLHEKQPSRKKCTAPTSWAQKCMCSLQLLLLLTGLGTVTWGASMFPMKQQLYRKRPQRNGVQSR